MLKLNFQYFDHPITKNWLIGKDPDARKDWRWEEKGKTEYEMVGWHHRLNGHEFEQVPGVGDVRGSLVFCSHVRFFAIPWTAACQVPSLSPRVCSNSCPLSQWYHPTISSSVIPFSSCLQSLPASGSFQMSQFFTSGGQSIGISASALVLPVNIQDWSLLGWTGWIFL